MSKISAEVRGVCRNFYWEQKVLKPASNDKSLKSSVFKLYGRQTAGLKKKKI